MKNNSGAYAMYKAIREVEGPDSPSFSKPKEITTMGDIRKANEPLYEAVTGFTSDFIACALDYPKVRE